MRLIVALAILLPTVAAGQAAPAAGTGSARLSGPPYLFTGQEDPVLLARALERTIQLTAKRFGGSLGDDLVVCVGLGSVYPADPSPDVLRRLNEHEPRVVGTSACRISWLRPGRLSEVATGRDALRVKLTSLEARGDTVVVYSEYWAAPLAGATWTCRATKRSEDWVVEGCERTSVS